MKSGILFVILLGVSQSFAGGLYSFKGEWFTATEQYAQGYVQQRGHSSISSGTIEEILKKDKALVNIWQKRAVKKLKNCSFEVIQKDQDVELTLTVSKKSAESAQSKTVVLPKGVFDQLVDYNETRLIRLSTSPFVEVMVTPYRNKTDAVAGVKTIYIATPLKGSDANSGAEQLRINMKLKGDGSAFDQQVSFGDSFSCSENIK